MNWNLRTITHPGEKHPRTCNKHYINSKSFVDSYTCFYQKLDHKNREADKLAALQIEARAHLLEYLYKDLDTIDQKASGLLTYCGLIITAITFLLQDKQEFLLQDKQPDYILIIFFILSAIAAGLAAKGALDVIDVHWISREQMQDDNLEDPCVELYNTRAARTKQYLRSRRLLFAATGFFVLCLVFKVLDSQLFPTISRLSVQSDPKILEPLDQAKHNGRGSK